MTKFKILILFFFPTVLFSNSSMKKDTLHFEYDDLQISADSTHSIGVKRLNPVELDGIYAGRKSEIVELNNKLGNLAVNRSRNIFAKIAGINAWEGEFGGTQMSIGGRGLNPNRMSNFNTRQNGYDIAADALGYPESYYTPPSEALQRIEIVRGAAALQYGTQFGGFVNFKLKEGPKNKKLQVNLRQTSGSFGLFNSFNSIGGQIGKLNYYSYVQYKRGDGYRENSQFDHIGAYAGLTYQLNKKSNINLEFTKMNYLAKQPGGLTDDQAEDNSRQSFRDRNWFNVDWNILALEFNHKFNNSLSLNIRNFALMASRYSVGYLGLPTRVDDPNIPRDLIKGDYFNIGNESRLLYRYNLGSYYGALITGFRLYKGRTAQTQGFGTSGSDANFSFVQQNDRRYSDGSFPSMNASVFAENMINITDNFSITPGARLEFIENQANGFTSDFEYDQAGNVINEIVNDNSIDRSRMFLLYGVGLSYYLNQKFEIYSNFSRNYRAINFNDIWIVNPSQRIDENLSDERGYSIDLGLRGNVNSLVDYDLSLFYLSYDDRIGEDLRVDSTNFRTYRFRTNIAASRAFGVESFVEFDVLKLLGFKSNHFFSIYSNYSWIDARYMNSRSGIYDGNFVENSPQNILRLGANYAYKKFKMEFQLSYVSQHFTDAINSIETNNAIFGEIPSYMISDVDVSYDFKYFILNFGVNNLLNENYFTRRATGYPGPGILPSDGRNFYLTIDYQI